MTLVGEAVVVQKSACSGNRVDNQQSGTLDNGDSDFQKKLQ